MRLAARIGVMKPNADVSDVVGLTIARRRVTVARRGDDRAAGRPERPRA
jgi:hypothetical protein